MSTGDSKAPSELISIETIKEAHKRILDHIHRTPLLTSSTLDRTATERIGRIDSRIQIRLAFKSEHLQIVGAFKARGATNAVSTHLKLLQDSHDGQFDASKLCVLTHSSGNHAAAVACAARNIGAKAAVVMPRTAPQIKKLAVANYGARIVESEPTQAARESTAQALKDEIESDGSGTVVRFIHPYDDEFVIAGQGTMGLEIVQQAEQLQSGRRSCSAANENLRGGNSSSNDDVKMWSKRKGDQEPPIDFVVAPVGGGGMLSRVSTAVKGLDSRITLIGAEPNGMFSLIYIKTAVSILIKHLLFTLEADDAARIESGVLQPAITPPRTICDGLLTALSPRTMKHIQRNVEKILTVSEQSILASLQLVWERMKQIIEPSAAVGLAVVLDNEEFANFVQQTAKEKRKQKGLSEQEVIEIRIVVVWTGGNVELDTIIAALNNHKQ